MIHLAPVVHEPRHWLMGPVHYVRQDPLKWIPCWAGKHGDLFTIKSRLGAATIVADPELARQVLVDRYPHYLEKSRSYAVLRILMGNGLVTSSGEFWRGQRKLTQPAFHRRRLDAIFAMMVERSRRFAGQLAEAREPLDVAPLFSRLTLEIISRAMFSADVDASAGAVGRHIGTLNETALKMLAQPWRFFLPRSFPTPFTKTEYHAR